MRVQAFIIGFFITLFLTVGLFLYLQNTPQSSLATETLNQKNGVANRPDTKRSASSHSKTLETPDSFYQTIIDNNIFRPLGWQPPRKQPDYTLIGTAASQNAADSKAFILERRSNRLYTVKIGDTLDDARVKEIQSKRVTLHEAGKDIILHGGRLQFF